MLCVSYHSDDFLCFRCINYIFQAKCTLHFLLFVILRCAYIYSLYLVYLRQVVGPFAEDRSEIFGSYSSDAVKQFITSLDVGLAPLASRVWAASGCANTRCTVYDKTSVKLAVDDADVVFVALGTGSSLETEANDRTDIALPGKQLQLLMDAVAFGRCDRPVYDD